MISPLLSEKKNVWKGSSGSAEGMLSASSWLMRAPWYSRMGVPAGMSRAANTPVPCRVEGFTTCQSVRVLVVMGNYPERGVRDSGHPAQCVGAACPCGRVDTPSHTGETG